ncbi:MAG: methylthioribose-1-phosphate isomerase [Lysobacterales bacterium]|jgi:methylthioribose-1-phosphate isomerase|nr:MAG: methylthioribose-1-phosphate isomerase [Xanthomonadales bacterium]
MPLTVDRVEKFASLRALRWEDRRLEILDQRLLPREERWLVLQSAEEVAEAIRSLAVRGAPAIGIAAAYGIALEALRLGDGPDRVSRLAAACRLLQEARPTAVNLAWAVARMEPLLEAPAERLLAEAQRIEAEDLAANRAMAEAGAELLNERGRVLTHCNTGALATAGIGTALGVIRFAYARGRIERVYACETRPWLQGARLTLWELAREGIPASLIADGAGAWAMARLGIAWLIVGADRIAANGDTANKIGTLSLMIAARHHGVKTMVVAPTSSIDTQTASGAEIPIELRDAEELLACGGHRHTPDEAEAWNPVFDVTPAELIDVLVTERFVLERPNRERIAAALSGLGRGSC